MRIPEFEVWISKLDVDFITVLQSRAESEEKKHSLSIPLALQAALEYFQKKKEQDTSFSPSDEFLVLLYCYHALTLDVELKIDDILAHCSPLVKKICQIIINAEQHRLQGHYQEADKSLDAFKEIEADLTEMDAVMRVFLKMWYYLTRLTILYYLNDLESMNSLIKAINHELEDVETSLLEIPVGQVYSWKLRVRMWEITLDWLQLTHDAKNALKRLEDEPLLSHSIDRVTMARYHNLIAVLATRSFQLSMAKRHYERALDLSKEAGYERGYQLYSLNLLNVIVDLLQFDEAIAQAKNLCDYWKKKGNNHYYLVAKEILVKVLRLRHQKQEAARLIEEAASIVAREPIHDVMLLGLYLHHCYDLPVDKEIIDIFQEKFDAACRTLSSEQQEHIELLRKELNLFQAFHGMDWKRAIDLSNSLFKEALHKNKVDLLLKTLIIQLKIHFFSYSIFNNPRELMKARQCLNQYEALANDLRYFPGILMALLGRALTSALFFQEKELERDVTSLRDYLNEHGNDFEFDQEITEHFIKILTRAAELSELKPENIAHVIMLYMRMLNSLSASRPTTRLPEFHVHGILFYSTSGSPLHAYWIDESITAQIIGESSPLDIRQKEALLSAFLSAIKSFAQSLFGVSEITHITHGDYIILQKRLPNHDMNVCLIVSSTSMFRGQIVLNDLIQYLLVEANETLKRFKDTAVTGVQDRQAIESLDLKIQEFLIERGYQ